MNLHAIVRGVTGVISPPIFGTLYVSIGAVALPSYKRVAAWQAFTNVRFDVQALSAREIEHLDALNVQGVMRGVWLNGNIEGLDRPAGKGGDMLAFNGQFWLVTQVLETWDSDGWCHVACVLQNGPPAGLS